MNTLIRSETGRLGIFVPVDSAEVLKPRDPSFVYRHVKDRLDRDIESVRECIAALSPAMSHSYLETVPNEEKSPTEPYWRNGYFSGCDARALFAFIAVFKPKRYVEIGSGNSTRFARKAVDLESPGTAMTSIDPFPRASIIGIAHNVIPQSLLETDGEIFASLERDDILFHDGSHITFNGSDTVHFFLDVLPSLQSGVIVHLHDICLPNEYIGSFDDRGYNEQYMLAAHLLGGGNDWEILFPVYYANSLGIAQGGGVSFWMRKR